MVGLRRLVELDLSHNLLINEAQLPASLEALTDLRALDLSANSLRGLPPCVLRMSQLQVLNVSANSLGGFPEDVGELQARCILLLQHATRAIGWFMLPVA